MTWAELHGVLAGRGLVAADAALSAEAAVGVVTGVAYDSRQVARGQVFVALKGQHADGTAFARQAIERGAAAIVSEQPPPPDIHVPWTIVKDARLALALLAAAFYRHPSAEMRVVGITGTNGKTTTAYLIAAMFEAAGIPCGLLGTVAYRIGPGEQDVRESSRTTPEAPDVQSLLREMADRGCGACAMEVSSHALSLRRVDGMTFAAGVFTNLTRDHLDFHEDMEAYFQAKRRLFEMLPRDAPSLVNLDDPRGASLLDAGGRPVTYAIGRPADITPGPLSYSLDGLSFDVRTPRGTVSVRSKLVGRPNVYNILAAVSAATALDVPLDAIERGLQALKGVPGRFEVVSSAERRSHGGRRLRAHRRCAPQSARDGAGACVPPADYGVRLRRRSRQDEAAADGRGRRAVERSDRDHLGQPAQRGSGADHRRDSARHHARHAARAGAQRLMTIADRRDAIAKAIELAKPGDLVLVAGKGHEKDQVIGDRVLPFDDVAVARDALARRRTNSGVV